MRGPILFAAGATLALQLGAQALVTKKNAQYFMQQKTRDQFLVENVNHYMAVQWINRHLTPEHRILTDARYLIYLIDVPTFYAHSDVQAQIAIRSNNADPAVFWRQLRANGVTHLLVGPLAAGQVLGAGVTGGFSALAAAILAARCAEVQAEIPTTASRPSRTLAAREELASLRMQILVLEPGICHL